MFNSRSFRRFVAGLSASHTPGFHRRFKLILHNSDTGLMSVVQTVRDLTRFAEAEAMARMWDAHHRGRAVVLTTHYERAEYLAERFKERGLTVSLEPE